MPANLTPQYKEAERAPEARRRPSFRSRRALFAELHRIRIYAKEPGRKPDLDRPFVLEHGATVHDLAMQVHKDIAARLKYARLWGSARFDGQQVDREHVLNDRDVVELHG